MHSHLAARAVSVKSSFRTRMLELAAGLDDIIALGRGDPDFETPPAIVAAGADALISGYTHYTPPPGLPELREAIAFQLKLNNNVKYSADQIIVTNGAQEALLISILALVDPGDEVVSAGAAIQRLPTTWSDSRADGSWMCRRWRRTTTRSGPTPSAPR